VHRLRKHGAVNPLLRRYSWRDASASSHSHVPDSVHKKNTTVIIFARQKSSLDTAFMTESIPQIIRNKIYYKRLHAIEVSVREK
jgi:hypothetical protein